MEEPDRGESRSQSGLRTGEDMTEGVKKKYWI